MSKWIHGAGLGLLLVMGMPSIIRAQVPLPSNPDVSNCDNCDTFPEEWLQAEPGQLLDFKSIAPERRLDFLIGEWALYFPDGEPGDENYYSPEEPVGYETFEWYMPNKVIQADQYWGDKDNPGFRARSDFRFVGEENRWQMTWLAPTMHALFTGGYEGHGIFSFIEYEPIGDRQKLKLVSGMRYVFRSITKDQFVAEEWRQEKDGVGPFTSLRWRLLYRRVDPKTK